MSDSTPSLEAARAPLPDPKEIESGKRMAILSYVPVFPVGLIVAIVNLAQNNNAWALYHAKQALTVYLLVLAATMLSVPMMFICIGGSLTALVGVAGLALCIVGIVNAGNGVCQPLPVIGTLAEKWFAGIQKI